MKIRKTGYIVYDTIGKCVVYRNNSAFVYGNKQTARLAAKKETDGYKVIKINITPPR